jgi:hypothetical protein
MRMIHRTGSVRFPALPLLLLMLLGSANASSQTLQWRYRGGESDGGAIETTAGSDLNGATGSQRYTGGEYDGFSSLTTTSRTLDGDSLLRRYAGGQHDGFASYTTITMTQNGDSLRLRFAGGQHDGFASAVTIAHPLDTIGIPMRYAGGSHDGFASYTTIAMLQNGDSLLQRFKGGQHDGFASLTTIAMTQNGDSLLQRFKGGQHDGFASHTTISMTQDGDSLMRRFKGGEHDGFAGTLSSTLKMSGDSVSLRYSGGSEDGYASSEYGAPFGNTPQINVRAFLQGPWKSNDSMHTWLDSAWSIPQSQPYAVAPWFYQGNEFKPFSFVTPIVDWVLLELRTMSPGPVTVERRAGFLLADGRIVDTDLRSPVTFPHTSARNLYIVLRHRNHLAVMSASPITFTGLDTAALDFTASLASAYGTDPMRLMAPGVFALWAGDVNANGLLRYNGAANDRALIFALTGSLTGVVYGYYPEDVNMNGAVRYNGAGNDRVIIFGNTGSLTGVRATQVP